MAGGQGKKVQAACAVAPAPRRYLNRLPIPRGHNNWWCPMVSLGAPCRNSIPIHMYLDSLLEIAALGQHPNCDKRPHPAEETGTEKKPCLGIPRPASMLDIATTEFVACATLVVRSTERGQRKVPQRMERISRDRSREPKSRSFSIVELVFRCC